MKLDIWGFSGTHESFLWLFSGSNKILARRWLYPAKLNQMKLICLMSSEFGETWYLGMFWHPGVISLVVFGIQQNPGLGPRYRALTAFIHLAGYAFNNSYACSLGHRFCISRINGAYTFIWLCFQQMHACSLGPRSWISRINGVYTFSYLSRQLWTFTACIEC